MKPVPDALRNALQSGGQFIPVDCFSFTLIDGTVARYCSGQMPLLLPQSGGAGLLFSAGDILLSGLRVKSSIGLSVDEQTLSIAYRPTSRIAGQPWPVALREGLFNGATLQRDRAFLPAFGAPPIGNALVPLFHGRIAAITSIGRLEAELSVKSDTNLLAIDMPRNIWQASCLHTLFDSGCGLPKGGFSVQGTAAVGSSVASIVWSGATVGLFDQGTLRFESGANTGISRTVLSSTRTALNLSYPFDFPVAAGDSFTVAWGCDKTIATCQSRFNNIANFRGFPFVPPPETAG